MSRPPPSARAVALDLIGAVLDDRRLLDEAVAGHAGLAALAGRDRAFARLLTATTLRRLGQIDALIAHCLERPLPRSAAAARHALRLGVSQLVFIGTPPHAAVDGAVTSAPAKFKGLVNAVLRRLAREGPGLAAAQDAARLDTPDWLWQRWCATYGSATARAIAEAHLAEPSLDITVKGDPGAWAERLAATPLPTGGLRRALGGAVSDLEGQRSLPDAGGSTEENDDRAFRLLVASPDEVALGRLRSELLGQRLEGQRAQLTPIDLACVAVDELGLDLPGHVESVVRIDRGREQGLREHSL